MVAAEEDWIPGSVSILFATSADHVSRETDATGMTQGECTG
jgi:hypothetical protein